MIKSKNSPSDDNFDNNPKCAPNKTFDSISCISLEVLCQMAEAHNKFCDEDGSRAKDKIKLYDSFAVFNEKKYKKYLVHKFKKLYSNKCNSQKCWLEQPFIDKMHELEKKELTELTFRPTGPEGKFEWLNTTHIDNVMKQYETTHKDFKFLGAVPMDFDNLAELGIKKMDIGKLHDSGINKLGIVFNLDESWKSGSHWVAGYADIKKGEVYYFDSYGIKPERRVQTFMRRIGKFYADRYHAEPIADHNKVRHQYKGSECGVYSLNFILRMLNGESFENICNKPTPDDVVNKCRKVYFE